MQWTSEWQQPKGKAHMSSFCQNNDRYPDVKNAARVENAAYIHSPVGSMCC